MSREAFRRAVGFTADPKVHALGLEFGAAGPLCLEEAMAVCTSEADGGAAEIWLTIIAQRAFISQQKARKILQSAAEKGLIIVDGDWQKSITIFFPAYADWNPPDPTAAQRSQRYRDRKRDENGTGTTVTRHGDRHGGVTETSRPVTVADKKRSSTTASHSSSDNSLYFNLSSQLAERMLANDPKARVAPESRGWVDAIRRLVELDKRSPEEVGRVIDWCQADDFWHRNILSPAKLRQQFPQLWLRMNENGNGKKAKDPPSSAELVAAMEKIK